MGESKLGYQPALDGIRAVSIALVLAFHLGAPWLEGGYLGVSVFFTLSGFLITTLLLTERRTTGGIDVRQFYVRRLRRLLPASLLCLVGIALLASIGTVAAREGLRAGVFGALFQVANWEQLLGDHSYAELFLSPSPVDHFWSLAIEEQFYWVWPLAMAGLAALAPRNVARVLVGGFAVFAVAAFATARVLGGDAAYFASWARFAEILAGAALAAVVASRGVSARWARLAGPALVSIIGLAVLTPAGRGWAYEGGLPLFAVLSVALILGVQGGGPVASLLSREPIPWIGRISYGLYLYHWPVFTILDDAGVLEKLVMTFAISVASYYLVERPIRTGRWLTAPIEYVNGALIGFVAVVGGAAVLVPVVEARSAEPVVLVAGGSPAPIASSDDAKRDDVSVASDSVAQVSTVAVVRVVALFGDSIADWLLRDALPSFSQRDITLIDAAVEGCDAAVGMPEARSRASQILPLPDDCKEWTEAYPAVVENDALPVDVAVLLLGNSPMVDHLVGGRWIGPCDGIDWYTDDLAARVAYLRTHVDEVVLAVPSWLGRKGSFLSSEDHRDRSACIRDELTAFAGTLALRTVDMAELLCPAGPAGECNELREADGMHVDPEDAPAVLEWLLSHL